MKHRLKDRIELLLLQYRVAQVSNLQYFNGLMIVFTLFKLPDIFIMVAQGTVIVLSNDIRQNL